MVPGILQVDIKAGDRGWDGMIPAHTEMMREWERAWHMVIFNRNFLVIDVEGMRQNSKRGVFLESEPGQSNRGHSRTLRQSA